MAAFAVMNHDLFIITLVDYFGCETSFSSTLDQLFVGGTGDVYANYNNGKLPATVNVTLTGTLDIDQCGHKESKPFTLTGTANKDC